jgi:hypothetical protein
LRSYPEELLRWRCWLKARCTVSISVWQPRKLSQAGLDGAIIPDRGALMPSVAILLSVFALSASVAPAADIPQGTHVLLRMENSINTRTAKEGDFVYLRTAVPIANSGDIAVPVGSYVQGVVSEAKQSGRVKGRAQLAIRLETLTLGSGKVYKFSPHLSSVDSGESGQKVVGSENVIEQAPGHGQDAGRIAILAGSGAAIGGIADRSWKGAGIGAGVGSAVGLATVLLTRGKEVELRQGATLDVVFDRPVSLE